jgi:hypothetical protein
MLPGENPSFPAVNRLVVGSNPTRGAKQNQILLSIFEQKSVGAAFGAAAGNFRNMAANFKPGDLVQLKSGGLTKGQGQRFGAGRR